MGHRRVTGAEIDAVLAADVVAHLATLDDAGYPHVTPLWFHWDGQALRMTSLPDRPHLARLRAEPRVGVGIDLEGPEDEHGDRPNWQVRVTGEATLADDVDGFWTTRITQRYLRGPNAGVRAAARAGVTRVVIEVVPRTITGASSVADPPPATV